MKFFRSHRFLAAVSAGVLAIGLVGGAALAQEGGSGPSATQDAGHGTPHAGLRAIVAESGLDLATFRAGFAEGKSINEILEENGVDPEVVKAAVLAVLDTKLDEAVANGRIDQSKADEIYANAAVALDRIMAADPDDLPHGGQGGRRLHRLETTAEVIGIELDELAESLRAGETPADIAQENGVDPQAVIDALVLEANAKIDEVAIERGLTEEQVTDLKARALEHITRWVNEGRPDDAPTGDGMRGRLRDRLGGS
ncbi:MAG TPA: hypothetical protein VFK32_03805 [Tepidiformaceae bacterium]|nr:hypothetical protein [Tepidiformaceae bacterium]